MSIEAFAVLALEVVGLLAVAAGFAVLAGWGVGLVGGPVWAGLVVGGVVVLAGAWWAQRPPRPAERGR